ncbi:MAG: DNA replication/repair protein RecF [Oscillospiraceae bacterium]|jgi:DNA replication and repair protein RecF|nr:DNA replication/repair protein RecF [Oscillospiraceae bacterium]
MYITRLDLKNFRNLTAQTVVFSPHVNVVMGDNAQGKSNLLEAVFYFGGGKSFRARREQELIRFGETAAVLTAHIVSGSRSQTLEARFSAGARRVLSANGAKLSSPRELVGRLPCVFFGPENLDIVRAGAASRRRFLDLALCQLRPRYLTALSEYVRLYGHKTRLLRDSRPGTALPDALPVFNNRLAAAGAALTRYRLDFAARVTPAAAVLHGAISGGREALSLRYVTHGGLGPDDPEEALAAGLLALMEERAEAERAAARCLVGPHRDDIELLLDGMPMRAFGSQGQSRTAALALKLAERDIFREELGEPPVLLLDDVLSELDGRRQDFILHRLEGGQVIITSCEPGRATRLPEGKNLLVENGRVTADNNGSDNR